MGVACQRFVREHGLATHGTCARANWVWGKMGPFDRNVYFKDLYNT